MRRSRGPRPGRGSRRKHGAPSFPRRIHSSRSLRCLFESWRTFLGEEHDAPRSSHYEVNIAKLVPEIAVLEGGPVGARQYLRLAKRLEHAQMGGVGLVPAGQEPVDRPHSALRSDHQAGPPFPGVHPPVRTGHALEGSHDRGPYRYDMAAPAACGVYEPRGGGGHAVVLWIRALVSLER